MKSSINYHLQADDVLLYLTEPATTIPHLRDLIYSIYGYFLGCKANVDKAMAMNLRGRIPETFKLQTGFKCPEDGTKYLRMQIPSSLKNLYDANYKSIIQKISKHQDQWGTLPLFPCSYRVYTHERAAQASISISHITY